MGKRDREGVKERGVDEHIYILREREREKMVGIER